MLEKILTDSVHFINRMHTILLDLNDRFGLALTDKQMHFYVFGFLSISLYFMVRVLFKALNKISISLVAFLFTFMVLVGVSLAIEIEQRVTNSGIMDFEDVVSGVYGFFVFFGVVFTIELIAKLFNQFRS